MNSPSAGAAIIELAAMIERAVRERTGGCLGGVRAEWIKDRIVVSGLSSSYHGFQLAIESVRPFIHADDAVPVQFAIDVVRAPVEE